jgi:hypothetical protein
MLPRLHHANNSQKSKAQEQKSKQVSLYHVVQLFNSTGSYYKVKTSHSVKIIEKSSPH